MTEERFEGGEDSAPSSGGKPDLKATLTRKLGPLPVWGWAAGIGGGILIYLALFKKKGGASGSALSTDALSTLSPSDLATGTAGSPGLGGAVDQSPPGGFPGPLPVSVAPGPTGAPAGAGAVSSAGVGAPTASHSNPPPPLTVALPAIAGPVSAAVPTVAAILPSKFVANTAGAKAEGGADSRVTPLPVAKPVANSVGAKAEGGADSRVAATVAAPVKKAVAAVKKVIKPPAKVVTTYKRGGKTLS